MSGTAAATGLDHLVIGVHDLDAAGAFYERLGFTVGARNRHPWGTENRIVQFSGAFLELITVADSSSIPEAGPRRFSFGAFVRDALARGEGPSMLVLESRDAAADAARFAAAGIGDYETFFFEREGRRPDGATVRVAFSLAFAADPAAEECGFFVCQQHEPQNFWNPALQRHANGAAALAAVVMLAPEPAAHAPFLRAYSGGSIDEGNGDIVVGLPRGRIDVLDADTASAIYHHPAEPLPPQFLGFCVSVDDLDAVAARLEAQDIEFHASDDRIVVPAERAHGCLIAFERA